MTFASFAAGGILLLHLLLGGSKIAVGILLLHYGRKYAKRISSVTPAE